jgi:hypothetical protein
MNRNQFRIDLVHEPGAAAEELRVSYYERVLFCRGGLYSSHVGS